MKMATFQLFFQSGRAKDLSAPLYIIKVYTILKKSGEMWVSVGLVVEGLSLKSHDVVRIGK